MMTQQSNSEVETMTHKAFLATFAVAVLFTVSISTAALAQSPGYKYQHAVTESPDPENADNDALKIVQGTVYPDESGSITRNLVGKNLQINDLRNMLSVKYFFVSPRTCAGGSPRFQIQIDKNDGSANEIGNAFGYLGDKSFGGGCASDAWVFEDMTNGATKWDLSQLGGGMTMAWDDVETLINTNYPNHKIRGCVFADDSGSFAPTTVGTVYVDQLQCYNRTWGTNADGVAGASGF
jgi:hypothetical protein